MYKEYLVTDFDSFYRVIVGESGFGEVSVIIDENFGERILTYIMFNDGFERIFVTLPGGRYMTITPTDKQVNSILNIIQEILDKSVVIAERDIEE